MSIKNVARLADFIGRKTIKVINRSGATLAVGDLAALDITGSDGDVDAYATFIADTTPDMAASPLGNVIAIGDAHDDGWPGIVVALESIADNATGLVGLSGIFQVKIAAGDGTNPAIAIGGPATPTSGQVYLSAQVDGQSTVAYLLEAGPAAAAVALKWCIFDGWKSAFGPQNEV